MDELDIVVNGLLDKLDKEKEKLKSVEQKHQYKTNMTFAFPNSDTKVNLNVEKSVERYIEMLGTLINLKDTYEKATKELGIDSEFTYRGYSYQDWASDLKHRVNTLSIEKTKEKIAKLEIQINKILSPEQIRQKEIERLRKEMEDFD